jgi:DNA-binding LacI/PurR family transcriptional regulator
VSSVVRGVESVCAELGYRMFLSDSDGSADREERALRQAVATNAAGVVLYPVDGQANAHLLDELRSRHIPVVLVDRYRTDRVTDAVITDNFAVGYELTNALIDRGHRRIATLWSETRCTSVHDRLTGHRQALREHDLPLVPEFTVLTAFWPQSDDVRQATISRLLGSTDPPTAILCSNGFVLAAVASDLHQLGIDLSEQVELAGMDDAGPYDILPLTVVAATLPSREMGCRAMQVLAERIGSADPYADGRHLVLPAEIRTREAASGLLRTAASSASIP